MRIRIATILIAPMLALAGCRGAEIMSDDDDVQAGPARAATTDELPSGTPVIGTLDENIGTQHSEVGEAFTVTVSQPITTAEGETVVPAGAKIQGRVTALQESKRVGQQAAIKVDFEELRMNGRKYPFEAEVVKADLETKRTDSKYGRNIGIGAAGGAALGAIFGRSWGGALLGGALGAATGTAISLGTGDVEATIPAGTQITLRTTSDVELEPGRAVSQNR
jgi:hypothetical protein